MRQAHASRLAAAAGRVSVKQLRSLLELGVGFHHAAMEAADRELVEALFLAQDLPVSGSGWRRGKQWLLRDNDTDRIGLIPLFHGQTR